MNRLRDYTLSLPLDVRRELCKVEYGYEWLAQNKRNFPWRPWLLQESAPREELVAVGRALWLPASPIAIALHAAEVGNLDSAQVRVCRLTGRSWAWAATPWIEGKWKETKSDNDSTGHRAAVALLMKVMGREDAIRE